VKGITNFIKWRKNWLPAGTAAGTVPLTIGYYGEGHPQVTIVAGVHGDEGPWGAWAIHKFLERVQPDKFTGSLKIVPQANPLAMESDSRVAPLDHLDLNRVFPGDENGSYTERLAYSITKNALENANIVLDLHGGGSWCVNAFAFRFKGSEELAAAFNPPFILDAPKREGTLTRYANDQGSKVAAVEMGGRCEEEKEWAEYIATGIERCLSHAGVIEKKELDCGRKTVPVGPSRVLRPSKGGLLIPEVDASAVGTIVEKGTLLGRIVDPASMATLEAFEAPYSETALLLLRPRMTVLEGGAMTYVISSPLTQGD
jgi:predicted deacylase